MKEYINEFLNEKFKDAYWLTVLNREAKGSTIWVELTFGAVFLFLFYFGIGFWDAVSH